MSDSRYWLKPITLRNIWPALSIARDSFDEEFGLIFMTYVWYLIKPSGLARFISPATSSEFEITCEGHPAGRVLIAWSRLHEGDVRWITLDLHRSVPTDGLIDFLFTRLRGCRMLVVQSKPNSVPLQEGPSLVRVGSLPTASGNLGPVYTATRPSDVSRSSQFDAGSEEKSRIGIDAEFYIAGNGTTNMGLTGSYVAELWPAIGWGGWGTIRRQYARRDATFLGLNMTEDLVRRRGSQWFCIETTDGKPFRYWRRMYQHYGMSKLIEIRDFYKPTRADPTWESYIVFGKNLAESTV